MKRVIEVYIKNEEVPTQPILVKGIEGHPCTYRESTRTEIIMPEADSTALKIVREMAEKRGLEVKVYDVDTLSGKIRARLRGVRKTPTVVLEGEKIEDVTEDKVTSILK